MPTVTLHLSPHPSHVRTARLFAVTLGRMSGLQDPALDEVRLAVGEAVSRAVRLHEDVAPHSFVSVSVSDDDVFTVIVGDDFDRDLVVEADIFEAALAAADGEVPPGMSLGVIRGLVEDSAVCPGPAGTGTRVTMRWPRAVA
jgi:anti-sigma regulatory factor (Ser/Thr protein kinase)